MLIRRVAGVLVFAALAAPPVAHAGPFNVDPVTGAITATGNSLSFAFVSRSAGFTHWFGLFTVANVLALPDYIFKAPPDAPGATASVPVSSGTPYHFGLKVTENGMLWFSDGTQTPVDLTQAIKFTFLNLDQYTTRIYMEDLKNKYPSTGICYTGGFQESCDYNDMVVDVTNNPEPATIGLIALGLSSMAGAGYFKRRRK